MISILLKVTTRYDDIQNKIDNAMQKQLPIVTRAFVDDANIYCREQTGQLLESSYIASDFDKGLAIWDTEYAKRVYYTGFPATNVNPLASLMWGHKALELNRDKYQRVFQEGFGGANSVL